MRALVAGQSHAYRQVPTGTDQYEIFGVDTKGVMLMPVETGAEKAVRSSRCRARNSAKSLILHDRAPREKSPFAGRSQGTPKTRVVTVCHTTYDQDGNAYDEWCDE